MQAPQALGASARLVAFTGRLPLSLLAGHLVSEGGSKAVLLAPWPVEHPHYETLN